MLFSDLFVRTGSRRSRFSAETAKTDASNGVWVATLACLCLWHDVTRTTRATATRVAAELSHRQWQFKPDHPERSVNIQWVVIYVKDSHKSGRGTVVGAFWRRYHVRLLFDFIFSLLPFMQTKWKKRFVSYFCFFAPPPTPTKTWQRSGLIWVILFKHVLLVRLWSMATKFHNLLMSSRRMGLHVPRRCRHRAALWGTASLHTWRCHQH